MDNNKKLLWHMLTQDEQSVYEDPAKFLLDRGYVSSEFTIEELAINLYEKSREKEEKSS